MLSTLSMLTLVALVLLAICPINSSSATETQSYPGDEFFHSVHPSRRDLLVKHYLTEALQLFNIYVTPDPRVANPTQMFGHPPRNFANNLLYWTRTTRGLDHNQIAGAVQRNNINTDETACSPQDIGCHCCPF